MAAYSAAKAGAAGFTRALARDVGRHGINVNNVALASIDPTGAMSDTANLSPEAAERHKKQLRAYIIRRFGRPDDVAAMVTFLASPLADWITGQTYPVNGGLHRQPMTDQQRSTEYNRSFACNPRAGRPMTQPL